MRVKLRMIGFGLVILCAACLYVAIACYHQVNLFNEKLVSFQVLLQQQAETTSSYAEEDLVQLRLIEDLKKQIKAQDDKIRIQDALIAEARAKSKRK